MGLKEQLRRLSEDEKRQSVDWDARKNWWLTRLDALYSDVKSWFSEYLDEGYVNIHQSSKPISEDTLGTYNAPTLELEFPDKRFVAFDPIASVIIGAHGRVELFMKGRKSDAVMLLLFRGEGDTADRWEIWPSKYSKEKRPLNQANLESLIESWLKYE